MKQNPAVIGLLAACTQEPASLATPRNQTTPYQANRDDPCVN